jgi:hypothetical protein
MPEPNNVDPKQDPKQDPNAVPGEGGTPPVADENDVNYWKKKYGDSENEKGELRNKLETEKANVQFFQQQAQQNVQTPPQQENGDIPKLDPMDEGFGQTLVGVIGKTVRKIYQEESAINKVAEQTNYLVEKYKVTPAVANNILNFGYQNGAINAEQAKQIFTQNFGNLGTEFLGQQQTPANQDPNPNPAPNQVKYDVTPPPVPAPGDPGGGSGMTKAPTIDEWNRMTDDEKRAFQKKVREGKVEIDSTNVRLVPQA